MTPPYGADDRSRAADGPNPPRALIVEDEILVAWDLQSTLEELGFQVENVVSDGMSALRLIEDKHFEVLFMDVNLSGAPDGLETALRIRQRANTPIIFVTAYSFSDSIYTDLRRIDISLVVGKPITRGAVTDALRKLGVIAGHRFGIDLPRSR